MKACPYCAEPIQDAAILCKHCGRDQPMPPPLLTPQAHAARAKARRQGRLAVAALVVGVVAWLLYNLIGPSAAFTACRDAYAQQLPQAPPLMAPSTRYLAWNRQRIIAESGAMRVTCSVTYRDQHWIVTDLTTTP